MHQERTIRSERVYEGKIIGVRVDTVELPSRREAKREIVEHGGAAAIVAVDRDGDVLLVRQYRKPVEKPLLEIPAGGIEAGEDPLECARRELAEETGFAADRWDKLGTFYTTPGFCTEEMHVFLATGLKPVEGTADYDETIELARRPLSATSELIASGEICDAKSIAGLLLALRKMSS